jgi:ribosomal-protein-alanine N-acetyltransferase
LIIPILRTPRLDIRTVRETDAAACHRLYNDIAWSDPDQSDDENLAWRRSWVSWSIDTERELDRLHQPPFGDRAVVDRQTGDLVGLVGLVPTLMPFGRLPSFGGNPEAPGSLEMGLFWATTPGRQRAGIATEAARALSEFAFHQLGLGRLVATTDHDNAASIAVMRRLGMTIERNPKPDPFYLQTVGRLDAGAQP